MKIKRKLNVRKKVTEKKKVLGKKKASGKRSTRSKIRLRKFAVHRKKKQSTLRTFVRKESLFERLALIGMGLIGSSIARGVQRERLTNSIVATARSSSTRQRVAELNLADEIFETNAAAVKDADLVIVCVPVGTYGSVAKEIGPHLLRGAIVSDVGSVKRSVVRDMSPHLPKDIHFIPAHPVAGTENSGPDAGFADLFRNRWCILTPLPGANQNAIEKLKTFWRKLRAKVAIMTPEHHDQVLAITSHIPHLIAYSIVGTALELSEATQLRFLRNVDRSFRGFTRIAASDPTMWRDIFLANNDAVVKMLFTFKEDLSKLTRAMRNSDGEFLLNHFIHVRALRNRVAHLNQSDNLYIEDVTISWTAHGAASAVMTHLPRLIAYTIVGTADELRQVTQSEVLRFSAGGFRDFTSITASDPNVWRDAILNNKQAVLEVLSRFNDDLLKLTHAMRHGDGEFLFNFFQRMRKIRRGVIETGLDEMSNELDYDIDAYIPRPYSAD